MKSNNFFKELKEYFKSTPKEKILEEWAKSEKFDTIGPKMEEFLNHTKQYYSVRVDDPIKNENIFKNSNLNPKFSSGFLFAIN